MMVARYTEVRGKDPSTTEGDAGPTREGQSGSAQRSYDYIVTLSGGQEILTFLQEPIRYEGDEIIFQPQHMEVGHAYPFKFEGERLFVIKDVDQSIEVFRLVGQED